MKRSKLRNDFLKDRNDASQRAYRKKFWKSVKPLFSAKITVKEIINLTENGETLSSDTDIADSLMTTLAVLFKISIHQGKTS